MIHINLLPVRQIKQRAAARQQLATFIFSFCILLAVVAIVGFFQTSKVSGLQKDIATLQQEKQRLGKILKMITDLEKKKAIIEKQIAIVKQLKKSSSLTVHILDEVARITPNKRMWLNSLSQSGSKLSITAMALDNRTIAQYMEELKQSPYISDVNLASTKLSKYEGADLKTFSLTCAVGAPKPAAPVKPEIKK
jgi:type IV pilus assembly protein PilN